MDKLTSINKTILKNTRQTNRLHQLISTTFAKRNDSKNHYELWQNACANFHQNYSTLVFNCDNFEGEDALIELLSYDNAHGVYAREFAICFIELRPYYFRSGYLYKKLLRKLGHTPLNQDQLERYHKTKIAYRQYRLNNYKK